MFRIFTTEEFDKDFNNLDKSEQIRVKKIREQLEKQGDLVGRTISGLSFFREKRLDGKRVYFLVYGNISVILLLAISDKKAQHATINRILLDLSEYQQYVFETLKRKGIT